MSETSRRSTPAFALVDSAPPPATDFQAEVAAWADATFPNSTIIAKMKHLEKEFLELRIALRHGDEAGFREEMADCYLIMLHTAESAGFSLEEAAREKLAINRTRKWGKPDADGCVEHIRDEEARP